MKKSGNLCLLMGVLLIMPMLLTVPAAAGTISLWSSGAGDGTLYTEFGYVYPYALDSPSLSTTRAYYSGDGWVYQDIYIEIPILPLAAATVNQATLILESLGFGDWYSSRAHSHVYHVYPTSGPATGNLSVDQPHTWLQNGDWLIYDSWNGPNGTPGTFNFDVTAFVQQDLTAGLGYSTFKISTSRDSGGSIVASEGATGQGPHLYVDYDGASSVPLPGAVWLLGSGLLGLVGLRRKLKS